MKKRIASRRCGFTLMETLLAVALVGTLVSIFLTVFVPARGMVQQALTKQEAERITGILRAEMGTIRPNERAGANDKRSSDGKYLTAFDKGFYWLQKSKRPSTSIVIFSYRANTSKGQRPDGSYPAVPAVKAVPGKNSQLVSMACPMNSRLHKDDIKDAVGPAFIVKMTQLRREGNKGEFKMAANPGVIAESTAPEDYYSKDEKNPWGGTVFYRADFYYMSPPNPARYKDRTWKRMGRPLFSANMSFHR
ncbi:MAG: type II secretion system protein [Akkermansia sp.]|nr:type II secretion system protein [Akkermansia sp.]